jgi:hypothetical protein
MSNRGSNSHCSDPNGNMSEPPSFLLIRQHDAPPEQTTCQFSTAYKNRTPGNLDDTHDEGGTAKLTSSPCILLTLIGNVVEITIRCGMPMRIEDEYPQKNTALPAPLRSADPELQSLSRRP